MSGPPVPSATTLRQRMVRLPVAGVTARLGDRIGAAVNISLGGACMRLNGSAVVGSEASLVLVKGPVVMHVTAQVLRATPDSQPNDAAESWLVAVRLIRPPSQALAMIPRLLAAVPTGAGAAALHIMDRRQPDRLPDPACTKCLAPPGDVKVTARSDEAIVLQCQKCGHRWSWLKSAGRCPRLPIHSPRKAHRVAMTACSCPVSIYCWKLRSLPS